MAVLSVADIDRWRPGDVREVFHAARSRAEIAFNAADGIATLPVFAMWGGDAASAARDATNQTRRDLDAHGNEALAVARAADQAADGIEKVQADLDALRQKATSLGLQVNPATSTVEPGPAPKGTVAQVRANIAALQGELNTILVAATAVDDELAHAINMASGEEPIPNSGPSVADAGLTPTQIASDANGQRLREEQAKARAHVDQLQSQIDDFAANTYMGAPATADWDDLTTQITAAKGRLAELDALSRALRDAPETYLTQLAIPSDLNEKVLAAVAVGNPDTADKIAVTVPGVGSTTQGSIESMVTEASHLRATTQDELTRFNLPDQVAAIAWMGYDTPPNPINTGSVADAWTAMDDSLARKGASSLSSYLAQVHAGNPDAQLTLLGHSYGSLTSSLALQQLHSEGVDAVDDVVFYGSPGLELTSPDQLGLGPGHAYVMQAPHDPITALAAPASDWHGWGADPYAHDLFPELSSQAGTSPDGVARMGVDTHADYPRDGAPNVLRMSGYNFAAVIAGLPPNQLVMAPPPAPTDPILSPVILGGGY